MSLNPVFDVSNDVVEQAFDKTLCLFCQTAVTINKRGRPKNVTAADYQDFIDACRDHVKYDTGKYTDLHAVIGHKTKDELKSDGYCFHGKCRQSFDRDKQCISRKRKNQEDSEKEIREKQMCPTRVLRVEAGDFDYTKCLFCQEDTDNNLHDIMQDSKDLELKRAFDECPVVLQIYKIRSLSAWDAMASELKYHKVCWNKHIVHRQPETF